MSYTERLISVGQPASHFDLECRFASRSRERIPRFLCHRPLEHDTPGALKLIITAVVVRTKYQIQGEASSLRRRIAFSRAGRHTSCRVLAGDGKFDARVKVISPLAQSRDLGDFNRRVTSSDPGVMNGRMRDMRYPFTSLGARDDFYVPVSEHGVGACHHDLQISSKTYIEAPSPGIDSGPWFRGVNQVLDVGLFRCLIELYVRTVHSN